ncbi:MAG: response regulator [Terracidiphilus sp.]|jgi:CheY-like chemotaxis protein
MPNKETRLLIVDDEPSIRMSLSSVLAEIGYRVRTAEDGMSALAELRSEVPDILLSDLNMPGMSGFELLSVVRRRFPAMKTIAMSGMFNGNEVPSGLAADGFYQKGSSVGCLLRLIDSAPPPERIADSSARAAGAMCAGPIWAEQSGEGSSAEAQVTISCPECLRSFSQSFSGSDGLMYETHCRYCLGLIHYAIAQSVVQSAGRPAAQEIQRNRNGSKFQAASAHQNSN